MGYECSAFAIYNEPHFKPKENIQVGLQPVEISIQKVGNHFSVLESEKKKQTDEKLLAMQAPFPTVTVTTPDRKAASLTCVFLKR